MGNASGALRPVHSLGVAGPAPPKTRNETNMKKFLAACLLALPLAAVPSKAWAGECYLGPIRIDAGFNYHVNVMCNGQQMCGSGHCYDCDKCGPWYLYWPYEAHLQAQAPMHFPYWPSAQSAPSGPVRPASASAAAGSGYQTVAYYYYPRTTPNYWYGR